MDNIIFTQPFLMQGKNKIAEIFRVTPETVTTWVDEGAPIFRAGGRWQAEYSSIIRWLENVKPARRANSAKDD